MSNIKKHSKEAEKNTAAIQICRLSTAPKAAGSCPPCTVIRHPLITPDLGDEVARRIYAEANKENDGKYEEPVLNSILTLTRQMRELQVEKTSARICRTEDLTPRSKAVIIPKISQKLNFPHDKTVFRNLIPINVNDCNLLPTKKLSIRKKYIKSKNRVPMPDLGDFLDPLPPLEHHIPEPDIDLIHGPSEIDPFEEFMDFYRDVNPRWMGSDWEL